MNNSDIDQSLRQIQGDIKKEISTGRKPLGFYIHLLLMAGTACVIVINGAWKVLWALSLYVLLYVSGMTKPLFWDLTERKLWKDAIAGKTSRAVFWDYVSIMIDWSMDLAAFSAFSYAIFALADGLGISRPLLWICVGGTYMTPIVYLRKDPGYHWGNYNFWEQWMMLAIIVSSAFLPIGPTLGVVAQIAMATISIPLACRWKRQSILDKVMEYQTGAKAAASLGRTPPPPKSHSQMLTTIGRVFASARIRKVPFTISLLALVSGAAWTAWLGRPLAFVFAVMGVFLGFFSSVFFSNPDIGEHANLTKRGVDIDIAPGYLDLRAGILLFSLVPTATAVLWLGGRDARLLAALSLLAVGSCNFCTRFVTLSDEEPKIDAMLIPTYAIALSVVSALRIAGLTWWECLLPLPSIAYLAPVFRFFFPRSGLRGRQRKEAIADIPRRLVADIRSDAEKLRDEKIAKRRQREERRVARLRR